MTLSNLPPGVSGAEPQINPTDPPNALPELITPEQCYHLGDVVKDHGKGPYIITGMRLEVKRWDEEWLGDDDTGHVVYHPRQPVWEYLLSHHDKNGVLRDWGWVKESDL